MDIRLAGLDMLWPEEYKDFVSGFSVCKQTNDDYEFSLTVEKRMTECHGFSFAEKAPSHLLQRQLQNEILCADSDWKNAVVYCPDYHDPNFTLPIAAICSRISYFNAVLLHGSFVEHSGEGVVFIGYSGVGKTTQARLWNEFLGADIINGDKVIVRMQETGAFAYGSPWKGSSEFCENKNAPVKGIVVLRQAQTNKIRKIEAYEITQYFMPHLFLPHWDAVCMSSVLETVDALLKKVPVWLLECRPDEEAVKITKKTIFGM